MRSANGRTGYNFSAIVALVISECSVGEKCQRPHGVQTAILVAGGGSEKCDSSLDDNRFGDGNSEDPQQYVEGKKKY